MTQLLWTCNNSDHLLASARAYSWPRMSNQLIREQESAGVMAANDDRPNLTITPDRYHYQSPDGSDGCVSRISAG